MFDEPAFTEGGAEVRAALMELGRPGGILDADDDLDAGPVALITEPELSENNPNNPSHTAGVTFVGQFLDHDLTFDVGSRLGRRTPLGRSTNLRTAAFDLDTVYGDGPVGDPELYEGSDRVLFRLESGGMFEDLPRDDDGAAIIPDPRNDENLIISGLQCGFLMFHNAVVDRIRSTSGGDDDQVFAEARRLVTWHYQWLIVNEFLPLFVGQEMVDSVLQQGRRFYQPDVARIPVEFQTAAYRFGHSMVRPSYRANLAGDNGDPFFAMVFDPSTFGDDDPDDLLGGSRAERRFVDWQTFFDFGDDEVRPNKLIDTKISTPLFQLPAAAIPTGRGEDLGPTSLAQRNLLRAITWEIPSGQRVAGRMNAPVLAAGDLTDMADLGFGDNTPLWVYILREAEVMADGLHLGPVGGRIVAEVFLGILEEDDESYLAADPSWQPSLPAADRDAGFRMTDLLTIAGVDPDTRGQ